MSIKHLHTGSHRREPIRPKIRDRSEAQSRCSRIQRRCSWCGGSAPGPTEHGPSHQGGQLRQDLLEDDRPVVLALTLNLADGGITSLLIPTHQITGGNRCVQTNTIDAKLQRALLDKADKFRAETAALLRRVNGELRQFGISAAVGLADLYLHS